MSSDVESTSDFVEFPLQMDAYKAQRDAIKKIFTDIHKTIQQFEKPMSDACDLCQESKDNLQQLKHMMDSCSTLSNMLERKKLKIVFFGSTSSGKSTTLNALMRANLLPQGMRHVTNCFIRVEGTTKKTEYWKTSGDDERNKDMRTLRDSASAKIDGKVEDKVIEAFYSVERCDLLKHEIVFLDCPGFGLLETSDKMIQKHCIDGDAFIFVTSAVGEIFETELEFFEKVGKKLPRPNVFVLFNKWDESQKDEMHRENAKEDREAHSKRAKRWIESLQLQRHERDKSEKRIYFVSSYEALKKRLHEREPSDTLKNDISRFHPNHEERFEEFKRFENSLWKTTLESRFFSYPSKAREMLGSLQNILQNSRDLLETRRGHLLAEKKKEPEFEKELKKKMHAIFTKLENKQIEELVKNFKDEFREEDVNNYLKKLHQYVCEEISETFDKDLEYSLEEFFAKKKLALKKLSEDLASTIPSTFKTAKVVLKVENFNKNVSYETYSGIESLYRRWKYPNKRQSTSTTPRVMVKAGIEAVTIVGGTIGGAIVSPPVITFGICALGAHYAYDRICWGSAEKKEYLKTNYLNFILKHIQNERERIGENVNIEADTICRALGKRVLDLLDRIKKTRSCLKFDETREDQHYKAIQEFQSKYFEATSVQDPVVSIM